MLSAFVVIADSLVVTSLAIPAMSAVAVAKFRLLLVTSSSTSPNLAVICFTVSAITAQLPVDIFWMKAPSSTRIVICVVSSIRSEPSALIPIPTVPSFITRNHQPSSTASFP